MTRLFQLIGYDDNSYTNRTTGELVASYNLYLLEIDSEGRSTAQYGSRCEILNIYGSRVMDLGLPKVGSYYEGHMEQRRNSAVNNGRPFYVLGYVTPSTYIPAD